MNRWSGVNGKEVALRLLGTQGNVFPSNWKTKLICAMRCSKRDLSFATHKRVGEYSCRHVCCQLWSSIWCKERKFTFESPSNTLQIVESSPNQVLPRRLIAIDVMPWEDREDLRIQNYHEQVCIRRSWESLRLIVEERKLKRVVSLFEFVRLNLEGYQVKLRPLKEARHSESYDLLLIQENAC